MADAIGSAEGSGGPLVAHTVMQIGVQVWHWFSHDQAIVATLFSRKCGALESNPPSPSADDLAKGFKWTQETYRKHRSFAVASILGSAAFLEASINELYASAAQQNITEVGGQR